MTTITEDYRKQNAALHSVSEMYGTSGARWRDNVRPLAKWGRKAILDYGCGKGTLAKALGPAYTVTNYDPAIPELSQSPDPHPVVVCGDVLEHVEPECLDAVMKDLRRVTRETIFAVIALMPSTQTLSDGRNAHLILETPAWWQAKFTEYGFKVIETKPMERTKNTTWLVAQ